MAAPKKVDYERIEAGWRAGILSPSELAAEYTAATGQPVSHTAIIKHFKKVGVPRDLGAKIRAKADRMVSQAMVSGKVSAETTATDAKIIDRNAAETADVAIRHRTGLSGLWNTAIAQLKEVADAGEHGETLEEVAKLLASDVEDPTQRGVALMRMREALQRACGVPARVASLKALADTITKVIEAERTAWKLDDQANAGGQRTLTDLELASKLAFFVDLGRRRQQAANNARASGSTGTASAIGDSEQ
jgi:hypothetical protein